jgi:uncharacterized protein (TIGR03067 family)
MLLSLATIALCAISSPARAPVPKAPEAPSLDGSYTVTYTSTTTLAARGFGNGPGGPGGPGAAATRTRLLSTTATVSKGEITLGRRLLDADPEGPGRLSVISSAHTMAYSIDPATAPMSIDVVTIDDRNKRTTQKGLIEVADGRVTMALAKPNEARPKSLDEGEGVTVYYLKKLPPPPKVEYRIVAMTVGKEAEAEKLLNKLAGEGFDLVSTTNPAAGDPKASPTTIHFVLKRVVK